ncbi:MAG: hypothetical protein M3Y35_02670 [Actinomycetota bacterium]|nr:hypothetical protein [Actinomycetota bacterium]
MDSDRRADLAVQAWQASTTVAVVEAQLAELRTLQRAAIGVAAGAGVQQRVLAFLTDLSPGRVSQIVAEGRRRPVDVAAVRDARNGWAEWPGDRLKELGAVCTEDEREVWNRKYQLAHGRPGNLGAGIAPYRAERPARNCARADWSRRETSEH